MKQKKSRKTIIPIANHTKKNKNNNESNNNSQKIVE